MERQREEHSGGPEVQSSILSKNTPEVMSSECKVGLEGQRWLGQMNRIRHMYRKIAICSSSITLWEFWWPRSQSSAISIRKNSLVSPSSHQMQSGCPVINSKIQACLERIEVWYFWGLQGLGIVSTIRWYSKLRRTWMSLKMPWIISLCALSEYCDGMSILVKDMLKLTAQRFQSPTEQPAVKLGLLTVDQIWIHLATFEMRQSVQALTLSTMFYSFLFCSLDYFMDSRPSYISPWGTLYSLA